jgi:hypothetical protein
MQMQALDGSCLTTALQAIYGIDPQLKDHAGHLDYRWQQYQSIKGAITAAEGSVEAFAQVRHPA